MGFANPWALLLLLPAACVAYLLQRGERLARTRRQALAAPSLLRRQQAEPEPWRHAARFGAYAGACVLLTLALARPQAGLTRGSVRGVGTDVLIVLDLSNSMTVRDVDPSRFAHALYVAAAILDRLSPLDRAGLAAFSDEGRLECPVTTDLDALAGRLMQLEPGGLGEGSSDLSQAIRLACDQFPSPDEPGLVVILSDGEDLLQRMDDALLTALGSSGATVVTVGIGTIEGGRVPASGTLGRMFGDMVWNNQPVSSRLEEESLRRIAEASGGEYLRMDAAEASAVAERALAVRKRVPSATKGVTERAVSSARELYQIPLFLAALLLLSDLCIAALPADWSPRSRSTLWRRK